MALYKRGNTWHCDFTVNGQRVRRSTKETGITRARAAESDLVQRAMKHRIARGTPPLLRDLAVRFLAWVENCSLAPGTKKYYRNGWRLLKATDLQAVRIDRIRNDDVDSVFIHKGVCTTNAARRTLRRMLSKAKEWEVLSEIPTIKLLEEKSRERIFTINEQEELLAVSPQPLKDVLTIMLDSGMRNGEVFAMRWEDVHFDTQTILIPKGKTKRSRRWAPMSNRVQQALESRVRTSEWVFPSKRSANGHTVSIAKKFIAVRKTIGLHLETEKPVPYTARHTFATVALEGSGNLAAVMKVMGHSEAKTAMRYQHPGLDSIRAAIEARNAQQIEKRAQTLSPLLTE